MKEQSPASYALGDAGLVRTIKMNPVAVRQIYRNDPSKSVYR
jgi:hypothetical protein